VAGEQYRRRADGARHRSLVEGVVEGDIVIIELIDPNLVDPNA
jgi:hypothetical protein